ncbi:MAG: RDD family protein [Puniceicoccaceae bacterium]
MRENDTEAVEPEIVDWGPADPERPPEPEPGGLPARFGALCLDMILITALFVLLLSQVILPKWYPGAMDEMIRQFEQVEEEGGRPQPSENLVEAIRTSNVISLFAVYIYFTFLPVFLGGGTLGMRIFNLRIEQNSAPAPAPIRAHLIRGAIKAVCLQVFFPFLALLFLVALGNPRRMALHDMLARTRVVRGPAFSRP